MHLKEKRKRKKITAYFFLNFLNTANNAIIPTIGTTIVENSGIGCSGFICSAPTSINVEGEFWLL
jgi:hypothetical protein